ncbi:IS630 family transposase [Streptomyces sp. NPDC005480]|uniref:IS630 family transposase n=1 Tax=Streptomyces sp. NPDC005480 TaxID=3154880 RepID=UPI0033B054AD
MRRPASRPKSRRYPTRRTRPGQAERREFECRRHGTVSIVAAMDVATGQVLAERIERNDSATFIAFLRRLHQLTDPALRLHLIMDNGSSHTSRATRAWLTAHPRITVTHTPKHASWLNMVEQWFGALTRRLLRRGDFASRKDLEAQITAFTIRHNRTARPYQWRYDADADHARHPRPPQRSTPKPHDPHPPSPRRPPATAKGPATRGTRLFIAEVHRWVGRCHAPADEVGCDNPRLL